MPADLNAINAAALERGKKALQSGVLKNRPQRFVFITISGAHLYGFPSADSDIDLRGAHVLPLKSIIGLKEPEETYEFSGGLIDGIEVDCVSHDLKKYLSLLTHKNGYVLEQIFSPLLVYDSGRLEELRALASGAMTRHVVHHYKGFFRTQEKLILKEERPAAKAILYLFRVAMTGLHLLRTGKVEANILRLNDEHFHLPFIPDLVARKVGGTEKGALQGSERDFFVAEAHKLEAQLDPTAATSHLPDEVQNYPALDDFLVRERLAE